MKQPLIVYKVGTSSLTKINGSIDPVKIEEITNQLAHLHQQGYQLVLVTSGSIAAGFSHLGFNKRPSKIADKQASAAVGQGLLIEAYTNSLKKHHIVSAQVLLTQDDFYDNRRYQNAANALNVLLNHRAIPIINENDTVAVEEIKVGDNDTLSAQVASLLKADLLVLLTDVDGLYSANPSTNSDAVFFDKIDQITDEHYAMASGAGSSNGTGGMTTKLNAAKLATTAGTAVFICSSKYPKALIDAATQSNKGTLFLSDHQSMKQKKQWLTFYAQMNGSICIDAGAASALISLGSSLLIQGITSINESFEAGDIIAVYDEKGEHVIGKGKAKFSSNEVYNAINNQEKNTIMIHRDDWVSLIP